MMNSLEAAVRVLVTAVDRIDWYADTVGRSIEAIHRFGKPASVERLDAAFRPAIDKGPKE
jgi:hypothetical protein